MLVLMTLIRVAWYENPMWFRDPEWADASNAR